MQENHVYKMELGGRELIIESGKYCSQADGSCIVRCGDSVVLVNATASESPREGVDFFPLSIEFEEKMYAVGKIPGGFIKREGRPSEKAILALSLIHILRMCVACRQGRPKKELIRIVRNKEGTVGVDLTGKAQGRGAYLCPDVQCLERAVKSRALQRALECDLTEEMIAEIKRVILRREITG